MVFLLKFILENGLTDWSRAAEIIAGSIMDSFVKAQEDGTIGDINFFRYSTYVHPIGKVIYRATFNPSGYFKKRNITFDEILAEAKRINPTIETSKRIMAWSEKKAVDTIVNEVWPAFLNNENESLDFYSFASKKNKTGNSIYHSCHYKTGTLFQLKVTFEKILLEAQKQVPEMNISRKIKPLASIEQLVEELAFRIWPDFLTYQAQGHKKSFYHYVSKIDLLGIKIYRSCKKKKGALKKANIEFIDLLARAQLLNPDIKFKAPTDIGFSIYDKNINDLAQIIVDKAWPSYQSLIEVNYSFYRYASKIHPISSRIYVATIAKKSSLRKNKITFEMIIGKAKEINPDIRDLKKLKPTVEKSAPIKNTWDIHKAVKAITEEVWPAFLELDQPQYSFYTYATGKNSTGASIYRAYRGVGFKQILTLAKELVAEIDIEKSRSSYESTDKIVDNLVQIVFPEYLKLKNSGYSKSFYFYASRVHPLTKKVYDACIKSDGALRRRNVSFADLIEKAQLIENRIVFEKQKKEMRVSNKFDSIKALASEIWQQFLERQSLGHKEDYYGYASKVHPLGIKIYQSCIRKRGYLKSQNIKFIDLLKEAQLINPAIKFNVQKRSHFMSRPNLIERLSKMIAKRIWKSYQRSEVSMDFHQYARMIHPLGVKIYTATVNQSGFLKKQGVTFLNLLEHAKAFEPELTFTPPPAWTYEKALNVLINQVAVDYQELKTSRPSFFRYAKLTHPEGKKVYAWSLRQPQGTFHKLLKKVKEQYPDIILTTPKASPLPRQPKMTMTRPQKIKKEFPDIPSLESLVAKLADTVWQNYRAAIATGYRGKFYDFASKVDSQGLKIHAYTVNRKGYLFKNGINFKNLLERAKQLNSEIDFESFKIKKSLKPRVSTPVNVVEIKKTVPQPEKPKEPLKSTSPIELLKPKITEEQKAKNKIKALWPEYLKEKKYGTTNALFKEYVKNSIEGVELSRSLAHFDALLEETIQEIIKSTEGFQSADALFKFMRVLGERIEIERQAR